MRPWDAPGQELEAEPGHEGGEHGVGGEEEAQGGLPVPRRLLQVDHHGAQGAPGARAPRRRQGNLGGATEEGCFAL